MVSIIDYGMGNLRSVQKGFEKTGYEARIIHTPQEVLDARALVLPGVGAFRDCLKNLESLNLITPILKSIKAGKSFLGLCLGLQILFSESEEFGLTPGLDIIKGRVIRFPDNMTAPQGTSESPVRLKIPHMGWNTIQIKRKLPCLEDIPDESYFYFVHSYYVVPEHEDVVAATTCYGIEFTSCIWKDNIVACQFHPEKSQATGLKILKRFAETVS
ncbi:MAG: imidazole glycerol phosphate synthase subunit HisH [Proteobacteria bacterium]|nr:imidazole glycerol phosphate synthase subunit HisH [Pseudomonadota bacterium]